MNILLRLLQFVLAFATNTILLYFVSNEEAVPLLEILIYVSLAIQITFGTIGTYVQNRINSQVHGKSIEKPELLILHLLLAVIFLLFITFFLNENIIMLIVLLTFAQGGFNFSNSYLGISKSIKKSLMNTVYVYIIFFCFLLSTILLNTTLTAYTWILYFTVANLIVLSIVILQLDITLGEKFDKSKYLIFDKNLYVHASGHLTATFVGWFIFLYSRTFFSSYNEDFYPEFLKVAVVYSMIVGATELLYNTIFLTKVYRNPDDDAAYTKYSDGLAFVLVLCSFFILLISGMMTQYYFPPDFEYLIEVFRLLSLLETLRLVFNIWINNCARKASYAELIKIGLICMLLVSLLNGVKTIQVGIILISCVQVIIVYCLIKEKVLSLLGGLTYVLSTAAIVVLYGIDKIWNDMFIVVLIISIPSVLILKLAKKLNVVSMVKEFIHYD